MLTFEQPLLLLLLLPIGILVYLTWRNMSLPYPRLQRRLILVSRGILFASIILALAGASWARPVSRQSTVFVGDISASTTAQRLFMEQWITSALRHKRPDDQVGIVAVGRNALVEQAVDTTVDFTHFESAPDTNYTDLAAGLRLAAAILPPDSQRHIVLLSDGQQNLEDALQQAQILQQQGIRLDVVPLPGTKGADASIEGLDAPTQLHTNERFTLHLKLNSTVAQKATLHIYLDNQQISQQQLDLAAGRQELSLDLLAPGPGFHTFKMSLEAPNDSIPQNNEAAAFVNVQGAPRVLVIEGQPGSGQNIIAALRATKIDVTVGTPNDVPTSLDSLVQYNSVVLADVPAPTLGDARMQILQSFVRDLGHGLVVSGGQNSYSLGSYAGTPLEQTLPLSMDIPQHKDTPSIAVVLIVESLEAQTPINISKEAAKGVVGLLSPRDQVGISSGYGTLSIKMQHVTDKKAIDNAIDNLNPDDPPSYLPDFINAEQVLQHTDAKVKHVILLGDGDAIDAYQTQISKMAGESITVSTVATNANSPQEINTMQQIANWGKGRFYRADNPSSIPQILLQETERAARRSVINEKFNPVVVNQHPILTGFSGLPQLEGYIATTPKPAAQIILVSHQDDPVLAAWQYGLGRVVAWTSDALGLWTKSWLQWDGSERWWANLVTWSLPSADTSTLRVNGQFVNGNGQISVDLAPGAAGNATQQQVQAHIVAPDLSKQTITLQPSAPDHWEGTFPAGQVGAYLLQVIWQGQSNGNSSRLATTAGLVIPYSPEFHTQGTDLRFLQRLAQAGSGNVFGTNLDTTGVTFTQPLAPVTASMPLAFWLLILAALLLPLDIALRRLAGVEFLLVGYRWLLNLFKLRPRLAMATPAGTADGDVAVAPLSQLRAKREERRSRTITAPPRKSEAPTPQPAPAAQSQEGPAQTSSRPAVEKNTSEGMTAARLIEAKRKREQQKRS